MLKKVDFIYLFDIISISNRYIFSSLPGLVSARSGKGKQQKEGGKMELKKINYLPKWYEKKDLNAKQREIETAKTTLINTNKLTKNELSDLEDINILLYKDRYSKNNQIKRINELITFVNCR